MTPASRDFPAREQIADVDGGGDETDYRVLAEAIPQIVWTTTPDGAVDYYNQRWVDYTGLALEESMGWAWISMLHPDDRTRSFERWRHAVETGEPYEIEHRFRRRSDGSYRWHLGRGLPLRDSKGRIVKWFGTTTDIDDQKTAEEQLRFISEASKLLASSLDYETTLTNVARLAVPRLADWCAIDLVEPNGRVIRVHTAHVDPHKEALARELDRRYPPAPNAPIGVPNVLRTGKSELMTEIPDALIEAAARSPEHLRLARELKLRSYIIAPLLVGEKAIGAISFIGEEDGCRYDERDLSFVEDLARRAALAVSNARLYTELSHMELALRRSEERYRSLIEATSQIIWTTSPEGKLIGEQQGWTDFTGQREDEYQSTGWLNAVHPDDRAYTMELWQRAVSEGSVYKVEHRLRRHDGVYHHFSARAVPVRERDRSVREWIGAHTDITDRKRVEEERERLIEALERTNRDLDQFAYIASHDLKAPLRGIANLSQWIEEDIGGQLSEEGHEHMRLLRGRVHRMEALIEGILSYSRAGRYREPPAPVDVGQILAEVVELAAPPAGAAITIADGMPTVYAERVQLQQVFLNLLTNALKHARRADVRVEIGVADKGVFYDFTVSDNGPGIAKAYHERIWGIFQMLEARDKVEGTGIGLSVVKKIVETRGGKAWVESSEGQGATFHVLWPKGLGEGTEPWQTRRS